MREVFRLVAPDNVIRYEGGPLKVPLVDAGAKDNMVRSMVRSLLNAGDSGTRPPQRHLQHIGHVGCRHGGAQLPGQLCVLERGW
jgi:antitoxin VapB